MFKLQAEHVAPVSDLRLTNRHFASDLLECMIFQSLTRQALWFSLRGRVEQYQYHLRARLSNTDTTLRARLSKSKLGKH